MQQILDAIYENGVFRPLKPLEMSEGQQVRLVIESGAALKPDEMLKLAAQVYQGLSNQEIDEVEQTAFDRRNFFGAQSNE